MKVDCFYPDEHVNHEGGCVEHVCEVRDCNRIISWRSKYCFDHGLKHGAEESRATRHLQAVA